MGHEHDSEMVILSRQQCLARLAETPLGRVGVSIGALPAILPVHYAMVDDSIVFRTTRGTKLDAAAADSVVAFEVDAQDLVEDGWWSVLVQGIAKPVAIHEDRAQRAGPNPRVWPGSGEESRLLRLEAHAMHGRLFRAAPDQPLGRPID